MILIYMRVDNSPLMRPFKGINDSFIIWYQSELSSMMDFFISLIYLMVEVQCVIPTHACGGMVNVQILLHMTWWRCHLIYISVDNLPLLWGLLRGWVLRTQCPTSVVRTTGVVCINQMRLSPNRLVFWSVSLVLSSVAYPGFS